MTEYAVSVALAQIAAESKDTHGMETREAYGARLLIEEAEFGFLIH